MFKQSPKSKQSSLIIAILNGLGWSKIGIRSIRKFEIRLIQKGKKNLNNSMKINSKFVRFDSNYRVESNFSDAGFAQNLFDSKIYDSIDSKGEKWFKKFDKNQFKIRLIRFASTSSWNICMLYLETGKSDATVHVDYNSWFLIVFHIIYAFLAKLSDNLLLFIMIVNIKYHDIFSRLRSCDYNFSLW